MRLDQGQRGEELYERLNEVMATYTDGDRVYALGLLGAFTRRWLMNERGINQGQADMLITLALNAAEDAWRGIEARNALRSTN